MNRQLTEEETQIVTEHMKRCLISLVIKEMETQITGYDFTPIRLTKIRKSDNTAFSQFGL